MAEYPVDVAPEQIVRWLKDDLAAKRRRKLTYRATREYGSEPLEHPEEAGVSPDTDVAVATTTGVLEVRPVGVRNEWVLTLRVEDVVGPHVPEDESAPDLPEEIGLDDFYEDFVVSEHGTAFISVEAETPQAKRAFDGVLKEMITNRHGH